MSKRKFVITTRKTVRAGKYWTLREETLKPGTILTGAAGKGVDNVAADKAASNPNNGGNWDGFC